MRLRCELETRVPRRRVSTASLALVLAVVGCTTVGVPAVHGWEIRDRLRRVEVGQSVEQVHRIVRDQPVRKPGHPDDPFPTPLRRFGLDAASGESVVVELYVVATRPATGCPDVHYQDVPITYVDGRVAGMSWEFLEWRWREWGGSLAELRAAQDRYLCPDEGDPAS